MGNTKPENFVREDLLDVIYDAAGDKTVWDLICEREGIEKPQGEWVKGDESNTTKST